jgi:hypothetical protein
MSKFEITVNERGVSVMEKRQRTLYDAAGNAVQVPESDHYSAMGIGDFAADPENPTQSEIDAMHTAVMALVSPVIGRDLAAATAANASLLSAFEHVKASREVERQRVAELTQRAEQAERERDELLQQQQPAENTEAE